MYVQLALLCPKEGADLVDPAPLQRHREPNQGASGASGVPLSRSQSCRLQIRFGGLASSHRLIGDPPCVGSSRRGTRLYAPPGFQQQCGPQRQQMRQTHVPPTAPRAHPRGVQGRWPIWNSLVFKFCPYTAQWSYKVRTIHDMQLNWCRTAWMPSAEWTVGCHHVRL